MRVSQSAAIKERRRLRFCAGAVSASRMCDVTNAERHDRETSRTSDDANVERREWNGMDGVRHERETSRT